MKNQHAKSYAENYDEVEMLIAKIISQLESARPDLTAWMDPMCGALYIVPRNQPKEDERAVVATPFWEGSPKFGAAVMGLGAQLGAQDGMEVESHGDCPWTGIYAQDAAMWVALALPLTAYLA